MSDEEQQRVHVIGLVNQIGAVLAGERLAESSTALVMAVVTQIVVSSSSREERVSQARQFGKQVEEYVRRDDIVEWIEAGTTYFSGSKGKQ